MKKKVPCQGKSTTQIPIQGIVIASETLPAGGQGSNLAFFNEIATPLSGARNDTMEKGFHSLNRNLGTTRYTGILLLRWTPNLAVSFGS